MMENNTVISIIASWDGDQVEVLEMSFEELSDWVAYGHAYEEYDSLLVDGVEASELVWWLGILDS
jgi:hypothetical protein